MNVLDTKTLVRQREKSREGAYIRDGASIRDGACIRINTVVALCGFNQPNKRNVCNIQLTTSRKNKNLQ